VLDPGCFIEIDTPGGGETEIDRGREIVEQLALALGEDVGGVSLCHASGA
jgi:hypothetical protein